MTRFHFTHCLLPAGWAKDVLIEAEAIARLRADGGSR